MLVAYTRNFQWLFDNLKQSLLPCKDIELIEKCVSFKKNYWSAQHHFNSDSWYEAIAAQVFETLKFIKNETNPGEHFIISDVDIHFFQPNKILNLVNYDKDIIGVKERINDTVNTGFIIAKNTPSIINMYECVYKQLKLRRKRLADQDEINEYLVKNKLNFGYIDERFAGLGKHARITKSSVFFHAIGAGCLEDKKKMINRVKLQYSKISNK